MAELSFPLISAAVAIPVLAALAAFQREARARVAGMVGTLGASLCAAEIVREVSIAGGTRLEEPWRLGFFAADSLNAIFLLVYSLLTMGIVILAPRRDTGAKITGTTLLVLAATMAAYGADNLAILSAAWVLTALPFIAGPFTGSWRSRAGLAASCAAMLCAIGIIASAASASGDLEPYSLVKPQGHHYGGPAAFALLIVAIVFRKGIFPAHAWMEDAVESGPVLLAGLFINGHLGAFLLARVVIPAFPLSARGAFPILANLALFTAIYAAVRALAERKARRILALLVLSQSACILAGLESATQEGITGALVHCMVVSAATKGLFSVLRLLEVRFGRSFTADQYLGLQEYTPRLAVFFAVCGLALVGLPGTLGFCSEELLIHGTMASYPQVGFLLPVATAMNAVSLFRLFSKIFLGTHRTGVQGVGDALPRERWVLSAIVAAIVGFGLAPGVLIDLRANAAQEIGQRLANVTATITSRQ
ncbi:MAG TPA: proton-conducting transporter membrane subunit [Bryobacteraceae bacterium]|nr:proton-conducting transporter membrane subunit [Bryobacteraceae bacterium]